MTDQPLSIRLLLCLFSLCVLPACQLNEAHQACLEQQLGHLHGVWKETQRIDCEEGPTGNAQLIKEVRFFCDEAGVPSFEVTWFPFETYVDYWGTYSFDHASGDLRLHLADGNFIPRQTDLVGRASKRPDGSLVLEDISLGYRDDAQSPPQICGHILTPR